MPDDFNQRTVNTIDDGLSVYSAPAIDSGVLAQLPKGVEVQLEAAMIYEEREWIRATLQDGSVGYVLAPSARSHTTLDGASSLSPAHQTPRSTVTWEPRHAILFGLGLCFATVLGSFGSGLVVMSTQGKMPDNGLSYSAFLMLNYAVASALGLTTLLGVPHGGRLWAWGVGGFVVGAGLAGLLITIAMLSSSTPLFMLLSAFWLPPLVGVLTLLLKRSTAR